MQVQFGLTICARNCSQILPQISGASLERSSASPPYHWRSHRFSLYEWLTFSDMGTCTANGSTKTPPLPAAHENTFTMPLSEHEPSNERGCIQSSQRVPVDPSRTSPSDVFYVNQMLSGLGCLGAYFQKYQHRHSAACSCSYHLEMPLHLFTVYRCFVSIGPLETHRPENRRFYAVVMKTLWKDERPV